MVPSYKFKSIRILMDSIRSYSGTVFYYFCSYINNIGSRIVTYYLYYCLLFVVDILYFFLFFQTITTYCELILHKVKSFCLKTLYYINLLDADAAFVFVIVFISVTTYYYSYFLLLLTGEDDEVEC